MKKPKKKGWKDYKKLMVHKKVKEAEDVYSFYLVSPDQKALPAFLPGQYVSVRIPGQEYLSFVSTAYLAIQTNHTIKLR